MAGRGAIRIGDLGSYGRRALSRGFGLPDHQVWKYLYWRHLKRRLEQWQVDCVFDVGANRGQYARGLRELGYDGWIVSFEPVKAVYETLAASFEGDVRWLGVRCALGEEETQITLNVPLESSQHSSVLSPVAEWPMRREVVQMHRLDGFVSELPMGMSRERCFLKMDTQGFDLSVFRGAAGILDSIIGLQSELAVRALYADMPLVGEALEVYDGAAYVLDGIYETYRSGSDAGLVELDAIFHRDASMPGPGGSSTG